MDGPAGAHGTSLVPLMRGETREERYVYSETRLPANEFGWSMLAGVRGNRWAFVRAPRPELYDLDDDPGETSSLHEARPGLVGRLDGLVGEILDAERESVTRAQLTDEQVSALRSLGYLVSHEPPPLTGEDPKDMMYIQQELNVLMNHLERNDPERVLEGVEELVEKTPKNRELLMLRAQANARLGNLEPAIADMQECLAGGGSLEVDGTLLAMWLHEAGRSGEAEALLRSFVEAEPDFAQHSYNLGNLLGNLGRPAEAVAAYERALEIDPDNIPALVNLGFELSRLEGDARDFDRARAAIDHAIEIAHDDVPALMKIDLCAAFDLPEEGMVVARELQKKPQLKGITRQQLADALRRLQEGGE